MGQLFDSMITESRSICPADTHFSAISSITEEKLDAIDQHLIQLLAAPDSALDYSTVADLARATDEVVVSEIENWQSVFVGKHVSVPV